MYSYIEENFNNLSDDEKIQKFDELQKKLKDIEEKLENEKQKQSLDDQIIYPAKRILTSNIMFYICCIVIIGLLYFLSTIYRTLRDTCRNSQVLLNNVNASRGDYGMGLYGNTGNGSYQAMLYPEDANTQRARGRGTGGW